MDDLQGDDLYMKHRIHTSRLFSGGWVAFVVHSGVKGAEVETVQGEYQTQEEAVSAAKRYIEQKEEPQAP